MQMPQSKIKLKAPDRCEQLFDCERYLITDKHTNKRTDATKRIISPASQLINSVLWKARWVGSAIAMFCEFMIY